MLETERLLLREMDDGDFDALRGILSDPRAMAHYPAPFDDDRVRRWIAWNRDNYARLGFGLWAVCLKDTGALIGDCGVTMQLIRGRRLPEIGYHIHPSHWRRGYAKEAAARCRDFLFEETDFDAAYCYMKHTNAASAATARAIGMQKVDEYADDVNGVTAVYAMSRAAWRALCAQAAR